MAKKTAGRRSASARSLAILLLAGSIFPVFAWAQEEPSRDDAVQTLERLLAAIEIAAAELPRDSFDPQAIIDQVGTEPEALFAWVRDNTYLVPYKGVLRGPVGVLQDRMGNSLDRALLLRDLLRRAGHDALLATGTLTEEEAAELWAAARRPPPEQQVAAERPPTSESPVVERIASQAGLDIGQMRAWLQESESRTSVARSSVQERIERQTKELVDAVGDLDSPMWLSEPELPLEHWWVEIQLPTSIIDLDPSLPDAVIGSILTQPEERFSPDSLNQLRGLPDTAHTWVLRVLVERWEEGGLIEETALEHELFPADLHGKRVALLNLPLDLAAELDISGETDLADRWVELSEEQDEWLPILTVGEEQITDKSFTLTGELRTEPDSQTAAAGGVGGAAGGLFGGFGGALGGAGPSEEGHLTAQWLEYELRIPGKEPLTVRRELFDFIGPAARESGLYENRIALLQEQRRLPYLFSETEILALPNRADAVYYTHLVAEGFLGSQEALMAVAKGKSLSEISGQVDGSSSLSTVPGAAYVLALLAEDLDERSGDSFRDQLTVYSYHRVARLSDEGVVQIEGTDVIADGSTPLLGRWDLADRLQRGVAITNAEAALLEEMPGRLHNTALLFEAAQEQDVPWVTLKTTADPGWERLQLPEDVVARLRLDVEGGHLVVVPIRPVVITAGEAAVTGWWRVSPLQGSALGVGENGWGNGYGEYISIAKDVALSTACFITAGLGANSNPALTTAGELFMCVVGLNMRTAGWIAQGEKAKALGAVADLIDIAGTAISVGTLVASKK